MRSPKRLALIRCYRQRAGGGPGIVFIPRITTVLRDINRLRNLSAPEPAALLFLNDDQIGFWQPILLFLGERDSQNAVLKLCGHIFQLHALAHIKTEAAGASVALIDK